ncbi:hypothetical protein Q9Q94_15195 [Uliginosibacterium sp. 31-16]|uniref:hypothetical protein n=1 Tax=Uliginosibacterium sp. 31-16 TaxID=3068315 RepID=UPI00273EAB77|nr:hypothetical protein [Uliginosibacterium sp. 31-16]MDP5240886.1 hypothetical protein [Uliginosibacterium sp. 31-16]
MADFPTPRDLIDRRDQINQERNSKLQLELKVALYAYAEKYLIVSSTTGIAESGEPMVLSFDVDDEELGTVVLNKLVDCYRAPAPSYREHKLSDWRAFALSGAKTGRAFESSSIYISVETVNTALRVEACPRTPMSGIFVGKLHSVAASPEEIGSTIRAVIASIKLLGDHNAL